MCHQKRKKKKQHNTFIVFAVSFVVLFIHWPTVAVHVMSNTTTLSSNLPHKNVQTIDLQSNDEIK